jgi:hypothetical protein
MREIRLVFSDSKRKTSPPSRIESAKMTLPASDSALRWVGLLVQLETVHPEAASLIKQLILDSLHDGPDDLICC